MSAPLDVELLQKLLLVALSSDQPGEVMSALSAVKRALERAGHDHHWLVGALGVQPQKPNGAAPSKWFDIASACAAHQAVMRGDREYDFVESLLKQARNPRWTPTERQESWLMDIYYRFA